MMARMFEPILGKTMKVYIDDMLVKSKSQTDHLLELQEAFELMRHHRLRLNPEKCAFGVELGKFLEHLVSYRGIKVSPEQTNTILQMKLPEMRK